MLAPLIIFITKAVCSEDTAADLQCAPENYLYKINVKVHTNREVIKAINEESVHARDEKNSEKDALEDYYGKIFETLNEAMEPYRVVFDLDLRDYDLNDYISTMTSSSLSCERKDSIVNKVADTYEEMLKSTIDRVGLHLFVYGCMHIPSNNDLTGVFKHKACGRVSGVLYNGIADTKNLIISALLTSISNSKIDNVEMLKTNTLVNGAVCSFVSSCYKKDFNNNASMNIF